MPSQDPDFTRRSIEPEGIFDGLRFTPILLGALVDHLLTLLLLGLLVTSLMPEGVGESVDAQRDAFEAMSHTDAFVIGSLLLGALATLLGAFTGARLAGRLHVRHGGWIAVVSSLFALFFLLLDPAAAAADPEHPYPFWAEALGWLVLLPSGMLGGWLASLGSTPERSAGTDRWQDRP